MDVDVADVGFDVVHAGVVAAEVLIKPIAASLGTTASDQANHVCTAVNMVKINVPEKIARNGTSLRNDNANVKSTCCGKKNANIFNGPAGANNDNKLAHVSLKKYDIKNHKTKSLITE